MKQFNFGIETILNALIPITMKPLLFYEPPHHHVGTNHVQIRESFFTMLILLILLAGCSKTGDPIPLKTGEGFEPAKSSGGSSAFTVTTRSFAPTSTRSISSGGEISSSGGGSSVSARGVCYSTSPDPTTANSTVSAGSGSGTFTCVITGLTAGTLYHVRAYAVKNGVTTYGNNVSFTTLTLGMPGAGVGNVTDIDGNIYHTITLGTQVWMVENLKTTHFSDGSAIPNLTSNSSWSGATSPAYCDYNNDPSISAEYGRLYNLFSVKDSRKLAPTGWHIPSSAEFNTLINYLGGADTAVGRMKEAGYTHWSSPNTYADNSSGFTGLGSGRRNLGSSASFTALTTTGSLWSSSSSYNGSVANPTIVALMLYYDRGSVVYQFGSIGGGTVYGYGVRCIKD
jgi:uncharacterized protein (TIGR02145 family)